MGVSTEANRTEEEICPLGHYCLGGVKYAAQKGAYVDAMGVDGALKTTPCPAGKFGDTTGLETMSCRCVQLMMPVHAVHLQVYSSIENHM